jgi:hypothetical protein
MDRKRKVSDKSCGAFLVMWDQYGLEAIFDLRAWEKKTEEWEKAAIFSKLKEEAYPDAPKIPFQHLMLRAQTNRERAYEIYTFTAQKGIYEKDIRELFKDNPQFIADWIRKNGSKVFSSYRGNKDVVIR